MPWRIRGEDAAPTAGGPVSAATEGLDRACTGSLSISPWASSARIPGPWERPPGREPGRRADALADSRRGRRSHTGGPVPAATEGLDRACTGSLSISPRGTSARIPGPVGATSRSRTGATGRHPGRFAAGTPLPLPAGPCRPLLRGLVGPAQGPSRSAPGLPPHESPARGSDLPVANRGDGSMPWKLRGEDAAPTPVGPCRP